MKFVDSSFLIALTNSKDQWHTRALELKEHLSNKPVITDLVLSETITVVGSLGGGKAAREVFEFVLDNCSVEFLDKKSIKEVFKIYLKYDGKLSFADAFSVFTMKKKKINEILSFDRDFDRVDGIIRRG